MLETIRPATPVDLSQIVLLCREHAEYENSTYEMEGKEAMLLDQLFGPLPSAFCLVVVLDQVLIGYATCMKQFSTWDADYYLYMDCLYIKSRFRGQGIGQRLMSTTRRYAVSQNVSRMEWQTPIDNVRAIEFYTQLSAISKSKERFSWTV